MNEKLFKILVFFLSVFVIAFDCQGVELQVGKTGYPYSTINQALAVAKSGDIVKVMDKGIYSESIVIKISNITLDLNEAVISDYMIDFAGVDGVGLKNGTITFMPDIGIHLGNTTNCSLSNLKIEYTGGAAVFLRESSSNTIQDCNLFYNKKDAISLMRNSNNNIITKNTIRNGYMGISLQDSSNNNIISYNSVFNSKQESGISIGVQSNDNKILNNTVEDSNWNGIAVWGQANNNIVKDNVVFSNHGDGINCDQADNNLFQQNTIKNNWGRGIYISSSVNNTLENNIEENNNLGDHRDFGIQDDANLGHDASNDIEEEICWGKYSGFLSEIDNIDMYKIPAKTGVEIKVKLTSPLNSDFDVLLTNAILDFISPNVWLISSKYWGQDDEIIFTPNFNGFLEVRIMHWQGQGEYFIEILSTSDQLPAINVTSPKNGDSISGVQSILSAVSDDKGIIKVEYFIDSFLKYTSTTSPYSFSFDTRTVSNGARRIKAVAYDTLSQTNYSRIDVVVNNVLLISGYVKTSGVAAVEAVTLTFADGGETATTDASGKYSKIVSYGWTGTVTPTKAGYTFAPATRSYTNITTDQVDQKFAAIPILPPRIALSKTSLAFGTVAGGSSTSPQPAVVSNSGGGIIVWTATSNQSWLTATPASGTGTGILIVSVNVSGLAAGTYLGTITISDPNATNNFQLISVHLTVKNSGTNTLPIGYFDTPIDGIIGVTGSIPVTGWALDDIEVVKVEILRDNVSGETPGQWAIGDAIFVEGARPDIETAYPGYPLNYRTGWGYMMLTNFLPNKGNGTDKLYAYATDKEGNRVLLGTKTITCSNATAVKPFGTIDSPTQGGNASGNPYLNFGWVLTPLPKTVPKDGSTIDVYVDSVKIGNLATTPNVYNQYRVDVSTAFPGLNNTGAPGVGGPVGAYFLDTTKYPNGVHTIAWVATDDGGAADGIGSRYFNIINTGTTAQANSEAINQEKADSYESVMNLPVSFEPRKIKRGFNVKADREVLQPDNYGTVQFEIKEVERVEINLGKASKIIGYQIVDEELRPLPIGSTLDQRNGTFSWMPGPGFIGTYNLVFINETRFGISTRIPINVIIKPKYER